MILTGPDGDPTWSADVPRRDQADVPERRPEGYRLVVGEANGSRAVWVVGADARGVLFGVGRLIRTLDWGERRARLSADLDIATAPVSPIRGHQLGYRPHSNTYDGWNDRQYEQYIRELALFGVNSIENIPFQDPRPGPLMPLTREVMNQRITEICARYGLDYWLSIPAAFDLTDTKRRAQALADLDALFGNLPRLDALFFPGGDPGDNPPRLVMPYLEEVAARLRKHHETAKVLAVAPRVGIRAPGSRGHLCHQAHGAAHGAPARRRRGRRADRRQPGLGELREYPVPPRLLADRRLRLTFDRVGESHLNWRQHSRLNEVWLLKR